MTFLGTEDEEVPPSISVEFAGSASSGTDASSYTFSAVPLGTAAADRYIIVAVLGRTGGSNGQINGVTIGGTAATLLYRNTNSPDPVAFFGLLVPSGASATIAVTVSTTQARLAIGVWAVRNNMRPIPLAGYDGNKATASLTISGSIGTPGTGGYVIAMATKSSGVAQSAVWSAGVPRFNMLAEQHFTGADMPTNGSSADFTVTWTGSAGTTSIGLLCIR